MILRKIRKQLRVLLKLLKEDTDKKQLYYNYLIIDDHNYLFNFDELDEQFVRFNANIPEVKTAEVIKWAERYLYLWNEKITNEMIVEADENFNFLKQDESFMINTSTGFRVLRILKNGDVRNIYSFPSKYNWQMKEEYITAMKNELNNSKFIKNISAYKIALNCQTLINQLYLEYPKNNFNDIIVKDYKEGKYVMDDKSANRNVLVKNRREFENQSLRDIFIGNDNDVENNYVNIINLLTENNYIEKIGDRLNWIVPLSANGISKKKSLCTMMYILIKKDYLIKDLSNVAMSKIINNTFGNIIISDKTYGKNKNEFDSNGHYSKEFHFIK